MRLLGATVDIVVVVLNVAVVSLDVVTDQIVIIWGQ